MTQTYNLQLKRDDSIPNTWNLMGDLLGEDFLTSVTVQDGGLLIEVIDVNGSRHTIKRPFDFFTNKNNIEEILLNWKYNLTKEEKGQAAAYLNEFFSEWSWNETITREVKLNLSSFFRDRKFLPDSFYNELSKGTLIIHPSNDTKLWRYDQAEGIWKDDGESVVHNALSSAFGDAFKKNYSAEAIAYIQGKTWQEIKFNERLNLICVENGVVDLNTGELTNFSPDFYLTVKIPVKYNQNADCPKIKKFLSEVVSEADIKNLEELIGYCLYKGMPIHRAFLFVGGGSNGKSTLINIIKTFLGRENVASISLQRLTIDRFAVSALIGKLANLFPDLSNKAIKQTGVFKILTGNDLIGAERKFGGFQNFTNYAKFIFSCNEVPDADDDSNAFFRRWILINFPNVFEGDKANKNLINELTTPEELSGLLNVALAGLKSLLEKGDFSNIQTTEALKERYTRMASPVKAFIMDKLLVDSNGEITKDNLYSKFILYCKEKNYPPKANNVFAKDLKEAFQPLEETFKTVESEEGGKVRAKFWKGIKYVEEKELQTQIA